ncbi:MAG: DMP19 family protein [Chitinophagaceae bacterium]|nr:DMP19 family protein [Chitinophagaceae bacterium]
MSFFKKLFGGNNKNQGDNKPDIDALLSSPHTNNAIIEIDNYVGKLCSYGDTLDHLTVSQKTFYFNQNLEREINNGGFSQYFYNSSGNFAHETITSLRTIGANKTADILQQAIDQFPSSVVPKDRIKRQEILEQIEDTANEVWEQLDQAFYKYEDNLYDLNIEYIKQNRSLF